MGRAHRRERVAQEVDRRAPFLVLGERLEPGVLDYLQEARRRLVVLSGLPLRLGFGDAAPNVLEAHRLLRAQATRGERRVVRAHGVAARGIGRGRGRRWRRRR
ncbi:MAG: hypothetical protein U0235_17080 [Polyangiaceae bacterium]